MFVPSGHLECFGQLGRLWESFELRTNGSQPGDCSQLEDLFKWHGDALNALDYTCERKLSEGSDWEGKLDLFDEETLNLILLCHHEKGVSFDSLIDRKTIAVCSYVFSVIYLKCFLFASGVALEKFKDTESVSYMCGLTDRLSSLSNKWKWSSTKDSPEDGVLELWDAQFEGVDGKEDAMKLLYQWLAVTLRAVFEVVRREINKLDGVGDLNAEACRAKWGDELCELLENLDHFLDSDDTEFLYEEFWIWHCSTAESLLKLGNKSRAGKLLDFVKRKLDGLEAGTPLVPKWETKSIKYQPLALDPFTKNRLKSRVLKGLVCATGQVSYTKDIADSRKQMQMAAERMSEKDIEKYVSEMNVKFPKSPFICQLDDIMELVHGERFSEAEKKLKELDPKQCRSRGNLREFLEELNARDSPVSSSWEHFCQKQNLLLDACDDLGDRQLTAEFSQHYGRAIGGRSLGRLPEEHRWRPRAYGIGIDCSAEAGEVSSLKLWLEEELNLRFPSPALECVQEVISCLEDDCNVGEHKRELPEMLKACRLLKRSIDIYSDLLHNWTQGLSNEADWLQLCESQKYVHDTLKSYLLVLESFCDMCSLEKKHFTTLDQAFPSRDAAAAARFMLSTLVWVERGRARSLLSQLGPWYSMIKHGDENPGSLKDELIRFDKDEKAALLSISHSCRMASRSGLRPLFVEYVCLGSIYAAFLIKVQDVDEEKPRFAICKKTAFMCADEDMKSLLHFDTEKLQLAGEPVEDSDLDGLSNGDLEKLSDPMSVNKLLYVFYKIVPRLNEKSPDKECVVAKLNSLLEKLFDILIRPLWDLFVASDHDTPIIFVPDKMLYRVPFALLRDKKTKKYLFEVRTTSIAPSLRVLQHCASRLDDLKKFPLKQKCILAIGNPKYDEKADDLPGTGKELEHIIDCFPGRVKRLEKDEATRSKFLDLVKESSSSEDRDVFAFMHLGVHGHWSEADSHKTGSLQFAASQLADTSTGQPRTSQSHTLELEQEAGGETNSSDDGERLRSPFGEVGAITRAGRWSPSATDLAMLPSEDIIRSGIEWRTPLVVLSACNSSRGQVYYDGEVNLPRALMIAGVPAAVVSQWKIGDDASQVLMKALYARLRGGEEVASALRSAMFHTRNCKDCCYKPDSAQNIFEWGSFVVWGLPSVKLPDDICHDIDEDYRKLNALLESADNICALDKDIIDGVIFAVERIRASPWGAESSFVSKLVQAYTLVLLEDISRVELFFETKGRLEELYNFRNHVMFAQAMKGSPQKASECIESMLTYVQGLDCPDKDSYIPFLRQERAVIWRLMGEYDRALEEFNALLAFGENYECLTQMSYLKHLMGDRSGALEYARRAEGLKPPDLEEPGYRLIKENSMVLGIKALPDKYHRWFVNVDEPFTAFATEKTDTNSGNPGTTATVLNED